MSNNVIPFQRGQLASAFASQPFQDDLSAGVSSGFGILAYKGKVWSTRYRGETNVLLRDDKDGPRNSVEVVIIKAAQNLSKIWYENGYVDGSAEAPDCYSVNGVVPEITSQKKQSEACATCKRNQWGSKQMPSGKAGKECSDSKRLAVVPLQDIANESLGGPMLLRVPASSLQSLAQFGQMMHQYGFHYYAIGVRISFDPKESFPKFQFQAVRPLVDDEAKLVIAHQQSIQVERIINGAEVPGAAQSPAAVPAAAAATSIFEQPPAHGAELFPPVATPMVTPQVTQPTPQSVKTTTGGFGPMESGIGLESAIPAPPAGGNSVNPSMHGHGPVTEQTPMAMSDGSATTASHLATSPGFGTSGREMTDTDTSEDDVTDDDFIAGLDAQLKDILA